MSAAAGSPRITTRDRLGMTLFIAAAAHVMLILGVGFQYTLSREAPAAHQKLDIVLVHQRSERAPDEADQLAQADLDGAGNTTERVRAQAPEQRPEPFPQPDEAQQLAVVPQTAAPAPPAPTVLSRSSPDGRRTPPPPSEPVTDRAPAALTAAQLIERSRALTGVDAAPGETAQLYTRAPRKLQVTARTRAYGVAPYLHAWTRKVERVGNLNYPDEAARRRLSGTLILEVDINPDGSLRDVIVIRGSGERLLDDAAVRIVRLAAPFEPFPASVRAETDILQIVRAWQFLSDNRLVSQ